MARPGPDDIIGSVTRRFTLRVSWTVQAVAAAKPKKAWEGTKLADSRVKVSQARLQGELADVGQAHADRGTQRAIGDRALRAMPRWSKGRSKRLRPR